MKRTAIVSMFATCTMRCAYCDMAETGQVLDKRQLAPFEDEDFIARAATFFNSRTTDRDQWLLLLTGGEPMIAPNLGLLCKQLFQAGNSVAIYTNLHVGPNHPNWKFLLKCRHPQVEFIMASFHPETEPWEEEFFARIKTLKDKGHHVIVRFVGHPQRLGKLDELSERCREIDVCFYPSALLTTEYPHAYTAEERSTLQRHFSSLGQYIQLEGGIDTTDTLCHAGNHLIWVDLQSGNVTPCVTVTNQIIGNVGRNELTLYAEPIRCPQAGMNCSCLSHYQHDIVIGAEDSRYFSRQSSGCFVPPLSENPLEAVRAAGIRFYKGSDMGLGRNASTQLLAFSKAHVKHNYRHHILKQTDVPDTAASRDQPYSFEQRIRSKLPDFARRLWRKLTGPGDAA